ncbi:hypothetical protein [Chitinimonas sp.]|uniref:hypothetical protein n=1 Tax=Chitinimonas sp. TaxID=1934313 RepID=UPI002F958B47
MHITVTRDACCAQDDQIGPLDMRFEIHTHTRLDELVEQIVASHFLQYSGSHTHMAATIGEQVVAQVYSNYYCPDQPPQYLIPADTPVAGLLEQGTLHFAFIRQS